MEYDYDLAVIGSGPGGYVAAIRAGRYGLKTVLIEADELGGTCLNRGCIPTKSMLHAGEILHAIREAKSFGIHTSTPEIDLDTLYRQKDKTVKKLRGGIGSLLKSAGVKIVKGKGSLAGPKRIRVQGPDGGEFTAASIILATGSKPAIPPIPGLEDAGYWTSRTMLEENPKLPESMVIIGGGVIGVESATILSDLGVKVTIVEMMDQLLPRMEREVADTLAKSLKKSGIAIDVGVRVISVSGAAGGKVVELETKEGKRSLETSEVMVAVGRTALLEPQVYETAGVETDRRGVKVDADLQTTVPGIWAIGDVTGRWQLAHAASADAIAVVDRIAGRENHINRELIPSCVYTRPEIGSVGMTEAEAREAGRQVLCGTFPIAANSKSMIMGESLGFVKLVSDEATGEILGAHIVGPRATEMIAGLAVAMGSELTVEELGSTVFPHPTISEAVMEAAHDVHHLSVHKPGR